jgi:acyl carrier protein
MRHIEKQGVYKLINDLIEKILNNFKELGVNINDLETDFILENNIDSITFIEIILSLEEEFSVLIPEDYLLMENLDTVGKIANLIEKLIDAG